MIRRLLLVALGVLWSASCVAQSGCGQGNPNCILPRTAPPGTSTQEAASTAFVGTAINNAIAGLGTAFAPLASPNFTGIPTVPTPPVGDNSTTIVNSAWVKLQNYLTGTNLPLNAVTNYGADPSGAADQGAIFTTAFAAACGKTLYVPAGSYKFQTLPTDPHCGIALQLDPNAILDFSSQPVGNTNQVMTFSGTEGSASAISTAATVGVYSFTVASAAAFCQPANSLPRPACAARIYSNDVWDSTLTNHKIGEIRLIRSISGNVITLFEPLEDNYTTSPAATPIALISNMSVTGGTFLAPAVANRTEGLQIQLAFQPTVTGMTFKYFGGNGTLLWWDDYAPSERYTSYIGLGALNIPTANDAYFSIVVDATEYGTFDHLNCFNGGPCFTIGNTSNPGSTRHLYVTNSRSNNVTAFNEYSFQTHYEGSDINFIGNEVWSDQSSAAITAVSIAIPEGSIINNRIYNAGTGVLVENGTGRTGTTIVSGNAINTTTNGDCITILPQVGGSSGNYNAISATGNKGNNCGRYGLSYIPTLATKITSGADFSGNAFNTVGSFCMYLGGTFQRFTVSNNTCVGLAAAATGIYVLDPYYGAISNNIVELISTSTGSAYQLACGSSGSGSNTTFTGNVVREGGSPTTSFGLSIANNCLNTVVTGNSLTDAATPMSLGTGGTLFTPPVSGTLTSGHCVKSSTVLTVPVLIDGNTAC